MPYIRLNSRDTRPNSAPTREPADRRARVYRIEVSGRLTRASTLARSGMLQQPSASAFQLS